MTKDHCKECEGKPAVRYKKLQTTCFVCKKEVERVLDLHHTNANICSLECEQTYWLDIFY